MEVSLRGVCVQFGDFVALRGVDLELGSPGVTGLIGANGAGKTTLIHIALGLLPVTTGSISRSDGRVAYCPDTPSFEPFLTAREVLRQSAALSDSPSRLNPRAVLRAVGLGGAGRRRVSGYSRGMKQRLGIAAALVTDPDLLILDEPTSALDPQGRQEILELIATLGKRIAIIFSSHILSDVERVAGRVIVLHNGSPLYSGSADSLLDTHTVDPQVELVLSRRNEKVLSDLAQAGVLLRLDPERTAGVTFPLAQTGTALRILSEHASALQSLSVHRHTLQEAYHELVGSA